MADIAKLVQSVELTNQNIQNVKTRVTAVVGKLNQIKVAVATAIPQGGQSGGAGVNTSFLKKELENTKGSIAKFKSMIREAAESGAGAAPEMGGLLAMKKRQMHDDKNKTLYERLGGDLNLETSVELVYNKVLLDHRVRAYFEKNAKKMESIRKKMHQFLSGHLGGPKLYDNANLKPTHYHMNVTDYHVDAVAELFQQAFTELGIHPDAVSDAITCIGKIRKDLTTGCTVRMEMARKNTEKGKDALFKRLGGTEGISTFMDRLYDLIVIDNRLKKFFSDKNIKAVKEGQRIYITELLGGPKTYKGRSLEEVHKNMGVDDYFFDCFLMDVEKALSGLGLEDDSIDEVLVTLEPIRAVVLGRSRGVESKHKIVSGKSVLERLGGEGNVEAAIELMYSGNLEDPRVRYFFL